jgi:hypothetical protein
MQGRLSAIAGILLLNPSLAASTLDRAVSWAGVVVLLPPKLSPLCLLGANTRVSISFSSTRHKVNLEIEILTVNFVATP